MLTLPNRGGGPISSRAAVLVLLFYSSVIPMALFWPRLLRYWRLRNIAKWPETEAVVERANWSYGGKENSVLVAEISYSYRVEGERYSGYWRRMFSGPNSASDFVNDARGRKLQLRYKRGKPEKSFVVKLV
jgi:hypothetical protein